MVLKGNIDEIRYHNSENGYTIAVLDIDGEPVICTGIFPTVSEGQDIEAEGVYINHPKFGKQFKAERINTTEPDSLDGLIRYLGSGIFKGIGPKTAFAIVSKFQNKTLEIIEHQPFLLSSIRGISKEKAQSIGEDYKGIKDMRESMMFLQSKNISQALSVKIYKVFGDKTIEIVKENPYRLIEDVDGVGFITADRIASSLGIEKNSDFRVRAGIVYALISGGERQGNTFLPREELTQEAVNLLGVDLDLIDKNIEDLIILSKVRKVQSDLTEGIMLSATYRVEKSAAVKLIELKSSANRIYIETKSEISDYETTFNIKLHETQKEAVNMAVNNGISVITGGPGTGKTTIVKCILSIFNKNKISYELMAPTGRAAKKLSESTGENASTIHRALMLTPGNYSSGEMLSSDAIIVDEFSMVDIFLLNSLMDKIKEGTKLILVGDKNQLPSVGAGNVLADIMNSHFIEVVNLTQIYRQGEKSLITTNAHRINEGKMPELKSNDKDFFFTSSLSQEDIALKTVDLACLRIPNFINSEPNKIQILCALKNGVAGTININKLMQERLNGGEKEEIVTDEQCFKKGDRVMHIANNYSLEWTKISGYQNESGSGVFNGDLGAICEIRSASGEIDVLFEDGRLVTYTPDIRYQLILAYAITVHKSQGSEFDGVIMPIVGGNYIVNTRNLLYTSITRAKKIVVLVGEEYNIKKMVENNYIAKRYSMLKTFIEQAETKYSLLYGDKN